MKLSITLPDVFSAYLKKIDFLSRQATKLWPAADSTDDSDKGDIGYDFVCIITQSDLRTLKTDSNKGSDLLNSFFIGIIPKEGERSKKRENVEKRIGLHYAPEEPQPLPEEAPQVCTFLVIAHIPNESVARAGYLGNYFFNSETILIESVWLSNELQQEEKTFLTRKAKLTVENLESEQDEDLQVRQRNIDANRQTVLSWLLTYENPGKSTKQAALFEVITRIKELHNKKVSAVFLELENAIVLKDEPAQLAANQLSAFHGIGARYVKFAYEHPNTYPDKDNIQIKTRRYMLVTLPQILPKKGELIIDSSVVMSFIVDYAKYRLPLIYSGSNYKDDLATCKSLLPGEQAQFKSLQKGGTGDFILRNYTSLCANQKSVHSTALYLYSIPQLEQPRFMYRRSSIAFEILVDEDYFEPVGLHPDHDMIPPVSKPTKFGRFWDIIWKEWHQPEPPKPKALYCPVAHSGETDLFAYKYQSEPPYFTKYYDINSTKVTVQFPSYFEFTSEGRMENFYRLPDPDKPSQYEAIKKSLEKGEVIPQFTYSVNMVACVSYTYFIKSAVRVWHLVLKPASDDVSELEIIKLMRFFSGSQEHESEEERRKEMRRISFLVTNPTAPSKKHTSSEPLTEWFPGLLNVRRKLNKVITILQKSFSKRYPTLIHVGQQVKAVTTRTLFALTESFQHLPNFADILKKVVSRLMSWCPRWLALRLQKGKEFITSLINRLRVRYSTWRTKLLKKEPQKHSLLTQWVESFPLPKFKPLIHYHNKEEQRIQRRAWWVKTTGRLLFWGGLGLVTIGLWLYKVPHPAQVISWSDKLLNLLYWSTGLFLLNLSWRWLFRGIWMATEATYRHIKAWVLKIFIAEELSEEMGWLTEPDNLIKLLNDLTGVEYESKPVSRFNRQMDIADQAVSLRNVRSGVIEIDTGNATTLPPEASQKDKKKVEVANFLQFYSEGSGFTAEPNGTHSKSIKSDVKIDERNEIRKKVRDLYKTLNEGDIQMGADPDPFSPEEYADYVFRSYCGICLGIFDYDRMGFQEIEDTLVPLPDSTTDTSFMVIHRGVLAMLGYDDGVMDTFWNTLGINAYLLIPSALLAHNDMVARDAESRLDRLLNDLRVGKSKLSIRELNEERIIIDDLLNDDMLGNVFQYKTEQELYIEGMKRRGIDERRTDGLKKLEQLTQIIKDKHEESSRKYQQRITVLASLYGVFSFYTVVHDYLINELADSAVSDQKTKLIYWKDIPFNSLIKKLGDNFSFFAGLSKNYLALDLAHYIIVGVFIALFIYLIISNLLNPIRSHTYFWERRHRRSRALPKTRHAPPANSHS